VKSKPVQIFVRIGALKRFHVLKQKTAELPVTVSWDRRRGERRQASENPQTDQRKSDRRASPPFTWKVADFVVVEETGSPAKELRQGVPVDTPKSE
jgi:hypothetical protein